MYNLGVYFFAVLGGDTNLNYALKLIHNIFSEKINK